MMGTWQKLVLGIVVAAVLAAVGVWALWPRTEAVEPIPSPSLSQTPSPSQMAAPSPPSEAELQAVQEDIASGDATAVLNLLGEPTDGTVSPETLAQLKAMAIKFDTSTLRQLGDGPAWELTATDASGKSWSVGFLRKPEGQLVIAYQEPVQ
jgi:hypothetical protein